MNIDELILGKDAAEQFNENMNALNSTLVSSASQINGEYILNSSNISDDSCFDQDEIIRDNGKLLQANFLKVDKQLKSAFTEHYIYLESQLKKLKGNKHKFNLSFVTNENETGLIYNDIMNVININERKKYIIFDMHSYKYFNFLNENKEKFNGIFNLHNEFQSIQKMKLKLKEGWQIIIKHNSQKFIL